jgi:hypothetical protein
MARITVNTTGTQPHLYVSTDTSNVANVPLDVICLQDVTITNSTGIYSWTDFCSIDTNKITTPADNEITTNIVLDPDTFFGTDANATPSSNAVAQGIAGLSINKVPVSFQIVMNGDANTANAFTYEGTGYLSSLAPTVSPEAPVWVSPLTLAVDGDFTVSQI